MEYVICLINDVVVGTITKRFELLKWETFLKIIKSDNHKFIESDKIIPNGYVYDGENFIINCIEDEQLSVIKVHKSYIYHEAKFQGIVSDYTNYIIELLKTSIKDISFNFIINNSIPFISDLVSIKIGINTEQMINLNNFNKVDYFNGMDKVIDYSLPNIHFLNQNGIKNDVFYIAPVIYKNVTDSEKKRDTLTTFCDIYETVSRRISFLNDLNLNNNCNHMNLNDCFEFDIFRNYLLDTKIVINVHRSEHEHTFEELRCLPALMCKCLVISEISPFTEMVPYNNLVIWVEYDNLITKTKEVLNNYDFYFNKIFTPGNISLLNSLHLQNVINLKYNLNLN